MWKDLEELVGRTALSLLPGCGLPLPPTVGSIVPVPIGQMRNYYFPQRMADYVPLKEAQKLKKAGFIAQRDVSFGRRKEDDAGAEMKDVKTSLLKLPARPTRQRQPVRIDLNLLEVKISKPLVGKRR